VRDSGYRAPAKRFCEAVRVPRPIEEILRGADRDVSAPRLGGMARPDGVVIVSQRFWAFAAVDGRLLEGSMLSTHRSVRRVPLLRGLFRLAAAMAPLFRTRGVAPRLERLVLVVALLLPVSFAFLPGWAALAGGIALTVGLVAWIFRGRTLFLHGAEHRAISAVENRRLLEAWEGRAKPSRFAARCGTNFAALALPITFAADIFWPFAPALYTPFVILLLSLGITMELWQAVQAAPLRIARFLLAPGLALQRLTTQEPTLEETRIALRAVASVLERENGQMTEVSLLSGAAA
jgi:uncharacterized protein DUF1385